MNHAFLLYTDYETKFKRLTDEQLGKLLRYIFEYERTGVMPEIADPIVALSFDVIQQDLAKQYENYQQRVIAGKKSAEKRKSTKTNEPERKPTESNGNERKSTEVNDLEQNEQTVDPCTKNKNKKRIREKEEYISPLSPISSFSSLENPPIVEVPPGHKYNPYAPQLEDVREFIAGKGLQVDPEVFFNTYAATDWYKGGERITNWKSLVKAWDANEKKKQRQKPNSTNTGSKFMDIFMEEDRQNGIT